MENGQGGRGGGGGIRLLAGFVRLQNPYTSAPPPPRLCTNPLPVKHPRWRHRKPIYYVAFRSKITPALQAKVAAIEQEF